MINEKDIIFVTTTLYTKWLQYQSDIIKNMFPESKHIIIDGRNNWPKSWFYWIEEVNKTNSKYFIHIDEDFFITNKDELLKVIDKMEKNNIDLMGVPDGYFQYRHTNPIALNSFLMFGKIDKLKRIDLSNIIFNYDDTLGWCNNLNLVFKEEYMKNWQYNFHIQGNSNFKLEQEPYYAFMWKMKENGCNFDYLFPYFDDRFKSTNPRLTENSIDIGIHMWYTRCWYSIMDVFGVPNNKRYENLENYLRDEKIININ